MTSIVVTFGRIFFQSMLPVGNCHVVVVLLVSPLGAVGSYLGRGVW